MTFPTAKPLPAHLSHSQANALSDCGERYRLERVFGIRGVESWASVGGNAFHTATQVFDLISLGLPVDIPSHAELHSTCRDGSPPDAEWQSSKNLLDTTIETLSQTGDDELGIDLLPTATPEVVGDLWEACFRLEIRERELRYSASSKDWKGAGRKTQSLPRGEDGEWWQDHGLSMLQAYVAWRRSSGWQIATAIIDGVDVPTIEMNVSGEIAGIQIEAHMDRVFLTEAGVPVVVDLKTSAREPSDAEQLAQYGLLLGKLGLPEPRIGYYYVARKGEMGSPRDLTRFPEAYFEMKFKIAKDQRDNGKFMANTHSMFCPCSVAEWCWAKGGARANEVPRPWAADKPAIRLANTPKE